MRASSRTCGQAHLALAAALVLLPLVAGATPGGRPVVAPAPLPAIPVVEAGRSREAAPGRMLAPGARCPAAGVLGRGRPHERVVASNDGARLGFEDVDLTGEIEDADDSGQTEMSPEVRERLSALTRAFFMRADAGGGVGPRLDGRGARRDAGDAAARAAGGDLAWAESRRADAERDAPWAVGERDAPWTAAERDAPWTPGHLLADATNMNDEYVSLQRCPTSGDLYCVFQATDLGGIDRDIHIARSEDEGATWEVWEMPSFSEDEYMPELAIDSAGYLYVTWIRDDGVVVRSRSDNPDDPTAWEWVKGLTTGEPHATPTIAVSGAGDFSTVFIAAGWLTINWDLYVYEWTLIWMYSTNGGSTVTYDYFVPDGYQDYWPDAELNSGTCYLVNAEADYYTGELEVLVAADAVSGGFTSPVYCSLWTDMDCGFPTLAADGQNVYTVFQLDYDDGLGNIDGDIIYCYSWDGLTNVYGPYEIVADDYESVGPVVYTGSGVVGCLWLDAPPNADEFYLAARQASGDGHPDAWGAIETVTLQNHVEPTFRSDAGAVGDGLLHAAWIDRRDFPTQGLNVYASERTVLPNLAGFTPDGWGGPLVANMVRGERETGILAAGDTAFVSFSFWNDGLSGASEDFYFRLAIDGVPEAVWVIEGGLVAGWYVAIEEHPVVVEAPGPHELAFELDYDDDVAESDETDNVHAQTLDFLEGEPVARLTPEAVTHYFEEPALSRAEALEIAADPPLAREVAVPIIDDRLAEATRSSGRAPLRLVIVPAERVDPRALASRLDGACREDRRRAVGEALRQRTEEFRSEVAPLLSSLVRAGEMSEPSELWLSCSLTALASPEAVAALAGNPTVGAIWLDDVESTAFGHAVPNDVESMAFGRAAPGRAGRRGREGADRANAWHIARVSADDAWSQGYDGDGVVVGHLDSGVAYDHPDLAGVMWDGGPAYPNHGWDYLDEDNDPYDGDTSDWHGTHTAGLVAGDGSGGTATGAAPGARIMALRCVPGYQADMTEALQFALDEGADVVTMSAGWQNADDALKEANRYNADVLLAAGIPWCAAAGNGDNAGGHYAVPHDISSPGDCPNPWYGSAGHSGVIAVGATDSGDNVWTDSSYGPTEWNVSSTPGYDDYPYPPGLMKPDVAAPGVNVTSTVPGGYVAYSGTSMSTPIVAGAVAILRQASPGCPTAELAEALEGGALDLGATGRDNYAGAGRIDVAASLSLLPTAEVEFVWLHNDGPLPLIVAAIACSEHWLSVSPVSTAVDPGDSVRITLTFDGEGLADGVYFDEVAFTSNAGGSPHWLPVMAVKGSGTGVDESDNSASSASSGLSGYPNPFNPVTTVRFENRAVGHVRLTVHDVSGRLVAVLVDEVLAEGVHRAQWDGSVNGGGEAASGVYLLRLERAGGILDGKVTLLK